MGADFLFDRGALHGEQRLWEVGDLHAATEMGFDQGRPEGSQRYFTDSDWRTETWTDGQWEHVQTWHVEDAPQTPHPSTSSRGALWPTTAKRGTRGHRRLRRR